MHDRQKMKHDVVVSHMVAFERELVAIIFAQEEGNGVTKRLLSISNR